MSPTDPKESSASRASLLERIDQICDAFEDAWIAGRRPRIEDFLGDTPQPERAALLWDLLPVELAYRCQSSETLVVEDYLGRFPEHAELIRAVFAEQLSAEGAKEGDSSKHQASTGPEENGQAEVDQPERLGRYRITGMLGRGSFGVVYRGYDDELRREVAIKVPHRHRIARPEDVDTYLAEARVLASLDHLHIVPVYDVGRTADGLCFVVSKLIEGTDLKARMTEARLSITESAELVVALAEALHYAHEKRLVHRDLKPANILLDHHNKPYVTDFGLALREEDFGRGAGILGTPAYMSPEQANGEGHLVDGRSDIFSLGVIFYELLTSRRPFVASEPRQLLRLICTADICPPRQLEVAIPKELERICLKALAKRASERYTTAFDLADDLRHWLAQAAQGTPPAASAPPPPPVRIVPKGLRSFDAQDADFFLELLPGPRDREGLPESLRFWKSRVEERDPDKTFRVGLLYGPSGCGKSSLVKAGLLPRLAEHVTAIYIEAAAEETEVGLLKSLRKHCPNLPGDLGLLESLTALRRVRFSLGGKKLLLILDQFEQWLHAKREEQDPELVQALRQCDGERVQCIVMVRDDFWLAVSRFMQALEIRVVEGENSRLVDLFDLLHARKVLGEFGRAYGRLPDNLGDGTKEQVAFLDQAIAGLAQEGKVISVRLALFAEMVKGKPWTPATLKAGGGTEGVGVTFLAETFTALTAPLQHRLHEKAAQAVLKALLPETGTLIKGHMRSQQELLEASGYGDRSKDFDELLRILDAELRLITPTDPEGVEGESATPRPTSGGKYYQLTHDYLVHSLRDWLTRKQKETRRGRAELLLTDRATVWKARSENRQLPSLWQWLQIRWLTQKKNWTPPQRQMMRKATLYHALRGLVVAVVLTLIGWGGYEGHGRLQAHALRDRLLDANTNEVPTIVQDMTPYRPWLDLLLRDAHAQAEKDKDHRKQLHTSLALLPVDASQVKYLNGRLLDAGPGEVAVIREALAPHKEELADQLWPIVEAPEKGKESQRLRAAAALAKYDPESEKWAKVHEAVGNDLVGVPAVYLSLWMDALRPVRIKLLPHLSVAYRDSKRRETERSLATDILADYAADQPQLLADLLMGADEAQFAIFYGKFKEQSERGLILLIAEMDRTLPADMPSSDERRETLAKRQANAAVALLKMNQPEKVWPLLKHRPDPRARSYLIHRVSPLGDDAGEIIKRLDEETDVTIRRALLLSLGEFDEKALPSAVRQTLLPKLQDIYRTATDPGLHASSEWLLRTWQKESWIKQVNDEWAKDKKQRDQRLESIQQLFAKDKAQTPPQWYVNGQGQTLVVIPGPVEFLMGSPPAEANRVGGPEAKVERQHRRRIGRTFAIAAKSVTVEQYRKFEPRYGVGEIEPYARTADSPVIATSWYQAAVYCNWLSQQEGLSESEWCYEPLVDPKALPALAGKGGMKLARNYLQRRGYRLPTEAEWEYACRAGAVTSRYYGETDELLEKYAWYGKNAQGRTSPVGSKKPNDLGLSDMHGNVWTWCQEKDKDYPQPQGEKASEDKEDNLSINAQDSRVLRGGAFTGRAGLVRSAFRYAHVPALLDAAVGFRVARTFVPQLSTTLPLTEGGQNRKLRFAHLHGSP
jgi:serine/threonine protein kinase/formylglycine-generating enzyme required for sulfatase activity